MIDLYLSFVTFALSVWGIALGGAFIVLCLTGDNDNKQQDKNDWDYGKDKDND